MGKERARPKAPASREFDHDDDYKNRTCTSAGIEAMLGSEVESAPMRDGLELLQIGKITLCAMQPLEKAQNGKGLLLSKVGVGSQ
jgi:hypothetical protein